MSVTKNTLSLSSPSRGQKTSVGGTSPPQSRMIIFFLFPQILQLISQLSQREPVNPEFEFEETFMHFYLGLLWEPEERSEIFFPFFLLYEIKLFFFGLAGGGARRKSLVEHICIRPPKRKRKKRFGGGFQDSTPSSCVEECGLEFFPNTGKFLTFQTSWKHSVLRCFQKIIRTIFSPCFVSRVTQKCNCRGWKLISGQTLDESE